MAALFRKTTGLLTDGCGRALAVTRLYRLTPRAFQEVAASSFPSQQNVEPRPVSEIPGPVSFPLLGTLPSMVLDKSFNTAKLHKFWQSQIKKYGPILRMKAPGMAPMIILANPDDCEKLNRACLENAVRPSLLALQRLREESFQEYFENKHGIIIENGDEWWRVRSLVQTPMMKKKSVGTYIDPMDEVTLDFCDRIADFQSQFGEMPSDFQTELYKWALESVGLVALSRRLGCLNPNLPENSEPKRLIKSMQRISEALNDTEFGNPLWRVYPTAAYRQLKKSHKEFIEIADRIIRKTEAALMAREQNEDEELWLMERLLLTPGLTRKDVVTLILDMLLAGVETTSHTLAFTLYLLARNPEIQALLQKEIDTVLKDHDGPLAAKHLAKFPYMKAVIKESLRIFPLMIGMFRQLNDDLVLSGYLIPKGHIVNPLNALMGWDESIFPRPQEFLPERWLRHKPLGPIHPYASLPFGAGTRMCVGRRIAEQELYIFLARAMQRFNVDYKYKDIELESKLVFVPSEPLKFNFTERR